MGVFSKIRDASTKLAASIIQPHGEKTGFNVLTRPAKVYENRIKAFVNDVNGANMAVDADTLTLQEGIHNGIDNVFWTASAIAGVWVFNSLTNPHTGTHSIDATGTVDGSIAQFVRGAGNIVLNPPISSIGIWIDITSWSPSGTIREITVVGWDTAGGGSVGNSVDITDYVDITVLGVYQHAIIPLSDMGLSGQTIDAIRIETVKIGGGPVQNYYLDDIELLRGDPPLEYLVRPNNRTWLHVEEINITIVDAYSGIVTVAGATENATYPDIPYDGFLGLAALTNGIIYQRTNEGEVDFTITIKQLFDIIRLPGTEIVGYGGDGTNSWVKIRVVVTEPLVLKSENNDVLKMSISDDLSGLLEFQMSTGCREEVRQGDLYDAGT